MRRFDRLRLDGAYLRVCLGVTRDVIDMLDQGKSPREIRAAIDSAMPRRSTWRPRRLPARRAGVDALTPRPDGRGVRVPASGVVRAASTSGVASLERDSVANVARASAPAIRPSASAGTPLAVSPEPVTGNFVTGAWVATGVFAAAVGPTGG